MLEALYNLSILAETGVLTYLTSKVYLDWAWQKTVEFFCKHNVWDIPEIEMIMSILMKEKN
jgi:hypothetical protein